MYSRNRIHKPERCNWSKCAVLLATEDPETKSVLQHIDDWKLFVQVIFMGELNLLKVVKYLEQNDFKFLLFARVPSLVLPEANITRYDSLNIGQNDDELVYKDTRDLRYSLHTCENDICPKHLSNILRSLSITNNEAIILMKEARSSIDDTTADLTEIYNRVACNHVQDMVASKCVLEKFIVYIGTHFADQNKHGKYS